MNYLLDLAGALLYTVFITIISPLLFLLYSIFALIVSANYIHKLIKQAYLKSGIRKSMQPVLKYRISVRQLLHI